MTTKIRWTPIERTAVFSRASEILANTQGSVGVKELWMDAQTMLPQDRQRPLDVGHGPVYMLNKEFKEWRAQGSPGHVSGQPPTPPATKPKRKYKKRLKHSPAYLAKQLEKQKARLAKLVGAPTAPAGLTVRTTPGEVPLMDVSDMIVLRDAKGRRIALDATFTIAELAGMGMSVSLVERKKG